MRGACSARGGALGGWTLKKIPSLSALCAQDSISVAARDIIISKVYIEVHFKVCIINATKCII